MQILQRPKNRKYPESRPQMLQRLYPRTLNLGFRFCLTIRQTFAIDFPPPFPGRFRDSARLRPWPGCTRGDDTPDWRLGSDDPPDKVSLARERRRAVVMSDV